ncbi:MAG: thiamine phosphate synthase [Halorhodospira halophila]|uniref:thiamine phosphate synthase n=1 Tax=Halorhodospira TaxID=85108 RepID=UPI0019113F79|nr:thiamine phosphate synthase [Halorhodospira halophila]MCG5533487.1 thiamine phosphate synthase [Halorhodospira sp. 9621]MCG5538451.1 thiamine phosphate synthase [Halorhodospira sp. 9622]MCG5541732.1 thiamine phosphate synthase [Halorhodospira sp. M39old]MCG5544383.1 thiamine phosphate synthase [Halorhodospira sp. 9628]MCG5546813.1 thiamine phosphate synthase [Halorhodospira sp. M38]
MEKRASQLTGVYAVTQPRPDLEDAVAAVLRGGVGIVQYRDKGDDGERRRREATALRRLCADADALFLVNDDVALAEAVGAHGVHLGRDDGSVTAARQRLGDAAWIGVSCYDDLERARRLVAEGADYVAFGSVFPSPTKPESGLAPMELLRTGREATGCPTVAIGGIDAGNLHEVAAAGADAAAVVSALFAAEDAEAAARQLVAQWQRSR